MDGTMRAKENEQRMMRQQVLLCHDRKREMSFNGEGGLMSVTTWRVGESQGSRFLAKFGDAYQWFSPSKKGIKANTEMTENAVNAIG